MKAGKEHRMPLTDAVLALLGEAGVADALVFESEAHRESCYQPQGAAAMPRLALVTIAV